MKLYLDGKELAVRDFRLGVKNPQPKRIPLVDQGEVEITGTITDWRMCWVFYWHMLALSTRPM